MADFGDVVRQLMEQKGVTGVQLAQDIGITATSVSRMLNGVSKPRQLTLRRIMQRLCATPQEEQRILSAFAGTRESAPEEPRPPFRPPPQDEFERVTRYMEIKSMSVAFEMDVEAILARSGLKFTRYFRNDKGQAVGLKDARKLFEDLPNKIRDLLGIIVEVNLVADGLQETLEILVGRPQGQAW